MPRSGSRPVSTDRKKIGSLSHTFTEKFRKTKVVTDQRTYREIMPAKHGQTVARHIVSRFVAVGECVVFLVKGNWSTRGIVNGHFVAAQRRSWVLTYETTDHMALILPCKGRKEFLGLTCSRLCHPLSRSPVVFYHRRSQRLPKLELQLLRQRPCSMDWYLSPEQPRKTRAATEHRGLASQTAAGDSSYAFHSSPSEGYSTTGKVTTSVASPQGTTAKHDLI